VASLIKLQQWEVNTNTLLVILVVDDDSDVNTGLNDDGGELLDNLGRRVKVNQSFVDSHLVSVPRVGTLTTRRLAGGDLKNLGGKSDGTRDLLWQ
jgi:hypothetical protein